VRDDDCVRFLQWALPRLGMRWAGFRKVRSQVCKRIARRMAGLGLQSLREYRQRLDVDPEEWRELDRLCTVTISRFWRDRGTFRALEETVLPALAEAAVRAGEDRLDAWSCGCASGEEPYSLAILWHERLRPRFPGLRLRVLATDVDLHLLLRAGRGVYPEGSVRELPEELVEAAFEAVNGEVRVADRYRSHVHRVLHDARDGPPGGPFHLILCRNLAFTYFDDDLQRTVAARLVAALHPGGALVLGSHEELPDGVAGVSPWVSEASIYRLDGGPG
jgi:chemotaxis protein methyltransferase CheR